VNKNSQLNLPNENSKKVSVFSIESALNINSKIPLQKIEDPLIQKSGINLFVLRTDLNHPTVSGNKWYKLKYNLVEIKQKGFDTLLTFGGAYSNHIHAVASAGKLLKIKTIGVIRGEEYNPLNPTLAFAKGNGMLFHYVNRKTYRERNKTEFIQSLHEKFGKFYLLPEGGTNLLALDGCSEIVNTININYDLICCACGTGGTLAGIISGLNGTKKALGFAVLKGADFLKSDVEKLISAHSGIAFTNWQINQNYHFGGYAKTNEELLRFVLRFRQVNNIPIEPIYTGKMFYGIYKLAEENYFRRVKTIIVVHSGGLQGLTGLNERIRIKNPGFVI
jgi:1-aminocyclopropane-1-carboxylate deaminase